MTVTIPEVRVQPENPLWYTFDRINNEVDAIQADYKAEPITELAWRLDAKFSELSNFVADMVHAGLVDFEDVPLIARFNDRVYVAH